MALFYCLMSDLKKPHHLKNTCWKDHYLLDALKTSLSTLYCFTMKASNTEAKLIHQHIQQNGSFHFAMHSAAERKQSASFVNFQIISNSSFENIHSLVKTEKFSTNHDCAQYFKLLHCWLNWQWQTVKKQLMVFFYTGRKELQSHMFSEVLLVHSAFSLSAC